MGLQKEAGCSPDRRTDRIAAGVADTAGHYSQRSVRHILRFVATVVAQRTTALVRMALVVRD